MDDQRQKYAFHEAGHAVASLALGRPFHLLTIDGTREYAGALFWRQPEPDKPLWPDISAPSPDVFKGLPRGIEGEVMIRLAGPVAEAGHLGRFDPTGWLGDLDEACLYAGQVARGRAVVDAWLMYVWFQAVHLLTDVCRWGEVEAVAAALLDRGTLVEAEVGRVAGDAFLRFDAPARESWARASQFLNSRRPVFFPGGPFGGPDDGRDDS